MKRRTNTENSILLKISMIVFIVLLAVYIPLKIYISHPKSQTSIQGEIDLRIFVTNSILDHYEQSAAKGPFTETGNYNSRFDKQGKARENKWARNLLDSLKSIRSKEKVLLIELCGIDCRLAGDKYSYYSEFSREVKLFNYDAVATGLPGDLDCFLNLIKSDFSSLPFTSANIINADGNPILTRWIIKKTKGLDSKTGNMVKIKVGIFSVAVEDYFSNDNPRNAANLINPEIASLEAVTKMKNESCNLIIALLQTSAENSIALAKSVPGIDILINASKSYGETQCRFKQGSYVFDIPGNSPCLQEINIKLAKDSLIVIPCE